MEKRCGSIVKRILNFIDVLIENIQIYIKGFFGFTGCLVILGIVLFLVFIFSEWDGRF